MIFHVIFTVTVISTAVHLWRRRSGGYSANFVVKSCLLHLLYIQWGIGAAMTAIPHIVASDWVAGFIGWEREVFDVDATANPDGDGSPEKPLRNLVELLLRFSFDLNETSPCLQLGGDNPPGLTTSGASAQPSRATTPRVRKPNVVLPVKDHTLAVRRQRRVLRHSNRHASILLRPNR